MPNKPILPTVDVICDLRQFNADVDDVGTVQNLWQRIGEQLVDQPLLVGQPLIVTLPEGELKLWIVDAHDMPRVEPDTTFQIVDVLRSPKLLYRCTICSEYGPLRCIECEKEGRETRLCSTHAHQIKDELSAYCPEHIPKCNCRPDCAEDATFRCRRCHRLFGEHVHYYHPNDPTVDYCRRCYQILFEQCSAPGCHHLGKSKCAYQTREMEEPCGKPLCAKHSYQWKIWGPHNRGVTLCEHHKRLLGATDPADLLFMMLTARAPYARRGRRQSLPNPFRLRRIINRNRTTSLTFEQLGLVLRSLESQVSEWGRRAERNYRYMSERYYETTSGLSDVEADLLRQIRGFYQQAIGWDATQQITGLEITDRYYKPGQPPRYRVRLYLNTANKGPFIGRGGSTINQLRALLNLEIDLVAGV